MKQENEWEATRSLRKSYVQNSRRHGEREKNGKIAGCCGSGLRVGQLRYACSSNVSRRGRRHATAARCRLESPKQRRGKSRSAKRASPELLARSSSCWRHCGIWSAKSEENILSCMSGEQRCERKIGTDLSRILKLRLSRAKALRWATLLRMEPTASLSSVIND